MGNLSVPLTELCHIPTAAFKTFQSVSAGKAFSVQLSTVVNSFGHPCWELVVVCETEVLVS